MVREIFSAEDLKAPRIRLQGGIVQERITIDKHHYLETWTEEEWGRMLVECHNPPVFYTHKKFYCVLCPIESRRLMQKHRLNNHRRIDHDGLKFYPNALEQNWPALLVGDRPKTPKELIDDWWTKHPDGQPLVKQEVKEERDVDSVLAAPARIEYDDDDFEDVGSKKSKKARRKAKRKPQRIQPEVKKEEPETEPVSVGPACTVRAPKPPKFREPRGGSPSNFHVSMRDSTRDADRSGSVEEDVARNSGKGKEQEMESGRDGHASGPSEGVVIGEGGAHGKGKEREMESGRDVQASSSGAGGAVGDHGKEKKREVPSDSDRGKEKKRKVEGMVYERKGSRSSNSGGAGGHVLRVQQ